MNVQLSSVERNLLLDVLKDRLGTMREEVYHAEAPKFKDELKTRESTLQALILKFSSEEGTGGKLLH